MLCFVLRFTGNVYVVEDNMFVSLKPMFMSLKVCLYFVVSSVYENVLPASPFAVV